MLARRMQNTSSAASKISIRSPPIESDHSTAVSLSNYSKRTCKIPMPGYIKELLLKFQHAITSCRQDSHHWWNQPVYGQKFQYADDSDASPLLPKKGITLVQKIVGSMLYYAIAVDPIMLVALVSIASQQANATEKTYDKCLWILNYAASNQDATIKYIKSGMVLYIHSDASYLSEPKACSRVGGH